VRRGCVRIQFTVRVPAGIDLRRIVQPTIGTVPGRDAILGVHVAGLRTTQLCLPSKPAPSIGPAGHQCIVPATGGSHGAVPTVPGIVPVAGDRFGDDQPGHAVHQLPRQDPHEEQSRGLHHALRRRHRAEGVQDGRLRHRRGDGGGTGALHARRCQFVRRLRLGRRDHADRQPPLRWCHLQHVRNHHEPIRRRTRRSE